MYKNKRVYTPYKDLMRFMYPSFRTISEIYYIDGSEIDVIYEISSAEKKTPKEVQDELRDIYRNHIILTMNRPTSEMELMDRTSFLEALSRMKNWKFPKRIAQKIDKVDEADFLLFIKMSLVRKEWAKEILTYKGGVYELFQAIRGSTSELMLTYFDALQTKEPSDIFSSFLTFMKRTFMFDVQKSALSSKYRTTVKRAKDEDFGVVQALHNIIDIPYWVSEDLKCLNFLLDLKGVTVDDS